jgi:hypothetical protein
MSRMGILTYGHGVDPGRELIARGIQTAAIGRSRLGGGGQRFYGSYLKPWQFGQQVQRGGMGHAAGIGATRMSGTGVVWRGQDLRPWQYGQQLQSMSGMAGSRLGILNYRHPTQIATRRPRKAIARAAYRMAGAGMGADRPWYEALFDHIETMTVNLSPVALQILDMSFDQQRAGWAQTSANDREKLYLEMIRGMSTGQSQFKDPRTQQAVLQHFMAENSTTRSAIINQAAGGDAQIAAQIRASLRTSGPWYTNPMTLLAIGGGALGLGLLTYFITRM